MSLDLPLSAQANVVKSHTHNRIFVTAGNATASLIIDKACEWFIKHWINNWSQLKGPFLRQGFHKTNNKSASVISSHELLCVKSLRWCNMSESRGPQRGPV